MIAIREIEELKNNGKSHEEAQINRTVYFAYWNSKAAETEILDIDDVIWDKDIPQVIENLKKFGIKEFTVSSTYSGVSNTLALLEEAGCKVVGFVRINSRHMDYIEGKREIKPAFKLIIE